MKDKFSEWFDNSKLANKSDSAVVKHMMRLSYDIGRDHKLDDIAERYILTPKSEVE